MKKILVVLALVVSIFLLNISCGNKGQVEDGIEDSIDSLWFSYSLVTNLTEDGMLELSPDVFKDSINGHETMAYFLKKKNPYIELFTYVPPKISLINLKDGADVFELSSPWVADSIFDNGIEVHSSIYKVPTTNTAVYILTCDKFGAGGLVTVLEMHGYWNNKDVDINTIGKVLTGRFFEKFY